MQTNSLLAMLISSPTNWLFWRRVLRGIDVSSVLTGVLADRRWVGAKAGAVPSISTYLAAGCGFGSSCFPKDVAALAALSSARRLKLPLIGGILAANSNIKDAHVQLVADVLGRGAKKKKLAILGLAFKPGTDDIRESTDSVFSAKARSKKPRLLSTTRWPTSRRNFLSRGLLYPRY